MLNKPNEVTAKHILVYGTLKSDQHNHVLIKDATRFVGKVRVPGYDLFKLGWYPGIRPNPQNKEGVECELYEFNGDKKTLDSVDYYEGFIETEPEISLFLRKEIEIDGDKAYIYEYGHDPNERALKIEGGVWE